MPKINIDNRSKLESNLNLLYSIFNRLLFKNKLPKVLVKVVKLPRDSDFRGYFQYKDKKPIVIIINDRDEDPVKVLVHEMVHVKHSCLDDHWEGPDHPPSFVRLCRSVYKKLGLTSDPGEFRNS